MPQLILFDDNSRLRLLPFTHTRPVADIRCGILTMRERWELLLEQVSGSMTADHLQVVFPLKKTDDNLLVNGAVFGNANIVAAIRKLTKGSKLIKGDTVIAANTGSDTGLDGLAEIEYKSDIHCLNNIWDIFSQNDRAIQEDFDLVTKGRKSAPVPEGITVSGSNNIFIEEGARIYAGCIINATTGPVYIGKDTEVLEGSMMRGPLAICEHAVVKMGAKLYGATTIGPGCKVGGEINNAVFFANSNKAHDGYLGNAVIGEWCNLGADTNCSNLKNNYDEIKIWDEHANSAVKTGLSFCGLFMGDHSKCAINTMFNTGTVVGVSANIFGSGFPEKFIPSFSWGGSERMTTYQLNRAMETANRMMARRGKELSGAELAMYKHIFDQTAHQRQLFANHK